MPDYKNGKIYTIRCRDDPSLIYVGSTTQPLSQRWTDHKKNAKNLQNKTDTILLYQSMREKGIDNFYIELYNECPCENREQLSKHEGKLIREIGTINSNIAGRTIKEYKEDNKTKLKEYRKLYQMTEQRQKYEKEYYELNKDIIREKVQIYNKNNKENKSKLNRQLYEKNKEKLGTIITCECGCSMRLDSKTKHDKSKKHIKLMEDKNSQQDEE